MAGGLAAAIAIILFVTAHEAGHFIAAKAVGMKATQFFFGFGPKIWSIQRGETEYGVKWLPFGGYVRIIGMNPLEEIAPEDMGRTYREKKFWERSVVVLAGVGTNFLLAFILFYGVVVFSGVLEVLPVAEEVVAGSPASAAGMQDGDVILAIGPHQVTEWEDVTEGVKDLGPGETTVRVERDGVELTLAPTLEPSETTPGAGYLGVRPAAEIIDVGPFQSIGIAGRLVGNAVGDTFSSLFQMVKPSSIAEYLGVFVGDTDVPDEIRPVSPIGIVSIGSQAESAASFVAILAFVNVILATINLLPLFPLDGGHFAVAVYEKLTGREADVRRLLPVAAAVIGVFLFLGLVAVILDVTNPIKF